MATPHQDKLFTFGFLSACAGNFLLFFGFYLLLPVFPVYLTDVFGTSPGKVGLILSSYTVSAMLVRPFSGYLADRFPRKTVYLLAYALFSCFFFVYPLVGTLLLFVLFRVLQGFAFGAVTTSGNTLVVDIMPASRRGEGLGYFGISNNLAMATGPMTGMMLLDGGHAYDRLFYLALATGLAGFAFATRIRAPRKPRTATEPMSLDRFFLSAGLPAGFSLLLMAVPYGITTSYLSLYVRQLPLHGSTGMFFLLMAGGLILSRTLAGKHIDQGRLVTVVVTGQSLLVVAFGLFGLLGWLSGSAAWAVDLLYPTVAVMLGVGYGMIFPSYNTLFVDLSPNNRRATASSTYLTSWDLGIGAGLVLGGQLAGWLGFPVTYEVGMLLVLCSTLFFAWKAGPHFMANKLR